MHSGLWAELTRADCIDTLWAGPDSCTTNVSDVVAVHSLTPAPGVLPLVNQACPCASTADAQPASGLWFGVPAFWCIQSPAGIQNAATKCSSREKLPSSSIDAWEML